MNGKLSLAQKLRSAHVLRWHMVRTLRQQTLAEHLALVQLIAMEVADAYKPGDSGLRAEVMEWGLWHDLPEVITGDIPTPFKWMLADEGVPTVVDEIERKVDNRHYELHQSTSEVARVIVTFSDLYEAINFLHDEGVGPRATVVQAQLMRRIQDLIGKTRLEMLGDLADVLDRTFTDMRWNCEE